MTEIEQQYQACINDVERKLREEISAEIGLSDSNALVMLPCPFCGGEGELNYDVGGYFVECAACGVKAPDHGLDFAIESEAVARWNIRAT